MENETKSEIGFNEKLEVADHELSKIADSWAKLLPNENIGIRSSFAHGFRYAIIELKKSKAMQEYATLKSAEATKELWIDVKDKLPELKTYYNSEMECYMRQVSREVIVTDGETTWTESYSEDVAWHKSITFWQELPTPPTA